MINKVLDLQALKTFVLGIELKSFALAAKKQHKSTSAVSAHLKKLEEQTKSILVKKEGRRLVPTEQGEYLLSYAKKMLVLNDELLEKLKCIDIQGVLSIGLQEDFSEKMLTECLSRFTKINKQVHLNTTIDKYVNLITAIQHKALDFSVTWEAYETTTNSNVIAYTEINWIASPSFPLKEFLDNNKPLPLVMVTPNCLFKEKAISALEAAGIRWELVYQSQSLNGIWPAVNAGIGVTVRTPIGCPNDLIMIKKELPKMGDIGIQIHRSYTNNNMARDRLVEAISKTVEEIIYKSNVKIRGC